MSSPVGELTLVSLAGQLVAVLWPDDDPRRVVLPSMTEDAAEPVLVEAARQLGEYFDGRREMFDLPLAFVGTAFQQSVWAALLTIPYGETRSYAAVAAMIGQPSACRAVGAANGRNPLSIIAPCHRVIGMSGKLTGFAGGLAVKRQLLALEARTGGCFSYSAKNGVAKNVVLTSVTGSPAILCARGNLASVLPIFPLRNGSCRKVMMIRLSESDQLFRRTAD